MSALGKSSNCSSEEPQMVPGLEGMLTNEETHFKMATVEEIAVNLLSFKASVLEKNICDQAPGANTGMMSYLEMKNCTTTDRHQSSCLN